MRSSLCLLPALLLNAAGLRANDDRAVELRVLPPAIELSDARDVQRVTVIARLADGRTQDVTASAKLRLGAPIASLSDGKLRPKRDGESQLLATFAGLDARAQVVVRGTSLRPPVSFANEVIPTLTRTGCNAGSCHGAAAGKNGFRLTLFGYDKSKDFVALTRELRGRRVDVAEPGSSLMLTKPTTQVAHKGGKRLRRGDGHYERLLEWVGQGASSDLAKAPALRSLAVYPEQAVLEGAGKQQQLVVVATYADGSDRDVTDLALIGSSDEGSVKVEAPGLLTSGTPGEAAILVRFQTLAVVSQVLVLDAKKRGFVWPESVKARNYVDEAIHAKLRKLRIAPAAVCDDATFVRRVYLDLLNVLPEPREVRAFLADARKDKRARLVDRLLRRPEFPDVWAMQWAEALRIESRRLEAKGMHVYTNWLRKAFHDDVPFDKVVHELLTSSGGAFTVPPTNFFLVERDPKLIAENVAQVFLGVRLQCAQCHNHPFERWTMDDYYGFAAFFGRVGNKRGEDPRERIVFSRGSGEVRNVRTGRNSAPRFLGGTEPKLARGADRRKALADWLTSKDNPWFATNIANRVFARFFGRGLVEPTDDVRVSNPPSHPALHRELGQRLIAYGYDLRKLIRDIVNSRSYQVERHATGAAAATFAGSQTRRMSAEQLLDAVSRVTGVATKYPRLPLGARATQVANGVSGNRFLSLFGRPARTSACTCERRNEPTLGQVLHLINGSTIEGKIRSAGGRLAKLLSAKKSDAEVLEELWLAAYARKPRQAEAKRVLAGLAAVKNRRSAWEDVLWAVLNSKEFLFQH